ncbi:MAG: hypothetical protein LBD85_02365 [Oscillospiraceae bacterium]|nr:hypothetical protein [Oscillospiraceae bacterium]
MQVLTDHSENAATEKPTARELSIPADKRRGTGEIVRGTVSLPMLTEIPRREAVHSPCPRFGEYC